MTAGAGGVAATNGMEADGGVWLGVVVAEGVDVAEIRSVGEGEHVRVAVTVGVRVDIGVGMAVGVLVCVDTCAEDGLTSPLSAGAEVGGSRVWAISGAKLIPQRPTKAAISRMTMSVKPSSTRLRDQCLSFVSFSSLQRPARMRRIIPQNRQLVSGLPIGDASSEIVDPVFYCPLEQEKGQLAAQTALRAADGSPHPTLGTSQDFSGSLPDSPRRWGRRVRGGAGMWGRQRLCGRRRVARRGRLRRSGRDGRTGGPGGGRL